MEQNVSWKGKNRSGSKETPRHSQNPKVYYGVLKSSPVVPAL
jgi:hypothetical protein